MVAAFRDVHRHGVAATLHDDDALDRRRAFQGLVGDLLERHDLAPAVPAVGGDEQFRFLIVDAVAQRLGAEAAEDDAVHGADARAGQHGDRQFGNERQVDRDAVALLHAERLQDVRELAHLPVEVEVRERAALTGFAFPDERGLVAARPPDVAVDAVDADVEPAADEPFRVGGCQSSTASHGRDHSSSPANFAQNASDRARPRHRWPRPARARRRETRATAQTCDPPAAGRRSRRASWGRSWRNNTTLGLQFGQQVGSVRPTEGRGPIRLASGIVNQGGSNCGSGDGEASGPRSERRDCTPQRSNSRD